MLYLSGRRIDFSARQSRWIDASFTVWLPGELNSDVYVSDIFSLKYLFIGNLDEKVNERVIYEIMIQAGRVVDLYVPKDKETNRPKGFAFAEYESEEIAEYAVKLFSGLVSLHKRTLRFAVGSCHLHYALVCYPESTTSLTREIRASSIPLSLRHISIFSNNEQISGQDRRPGNNLATPVNKNSNLPCLSTPSRNMNIHQQSAQVMTPCRFSAYPQYNFPAGDFKCYMLFSHTFLVLIILAHLARLRLIHVS